MDRKKPPKKKPPGMYEVMQAMGTPDGEQVYAAFLRSQAEYGDHAFLGDIKRSNLRPAAQAVAIALITGKLKRLTGRPADDITDVLNAYRALCVIDLETNGWKPRDAAIEEAKKHLKCSYSTIEKALKSHGEMLKAAQPEFLDTLRSAFK